MSFGSYTKVDFALNRRRKQVMMGREHTRGHHRSCSQQIRSEYIPHNVSPEHIPSDILSKTAAAIGRCCGHNHLKSYRLACGWTVNQAVSYVHQWRSDHKLHGCGLSTRSWLQWESGDRPSQFYQDLLCQIFSTNTIELGWTSDYRESKPFVSANIITPLANSAQEKPLNSVPDSGPNLLMSNLSAHTSVRMDRLEQLKHTVELLGVQELLAPPPTLLSKVRALYTQVCAQITAGTSTAIRSRLVRIAAQLAIISGDIMFDVGKFTEAMDWYEVALHACNDINDINLADIAVGGMCYIPTYSNSPQGVLALAMGQIARNKLPTCGKASLYGFAAKAYAQLGERYNFEHAVEQSFTQLEQSPTETVKEGIFSFTTHKLNLYQARGWVDLRCPGRAIEAADQALTYYRTSAETMNPALTNFEKASSYLQLDDIEQACDLASQIIRNPRYFHGKALYTRAHDFNKNLPTNSTSPAIGHWRDLLSTYQSGHSQPSDA